MGSSYVHYETLLRYGCENVFETVESWRRALTHFDTKVQLNLCNKKNLKFFLSSSELKQEACNLVLSYFFLVSKSIRNRQEILTDERITALNISSAIERLQNLFIESTALRYYVIRHFLISWNRFTAGIDTVSFLEFKEELLRYQEKKLMGTKYFRSKKKNEAKCASFKSIVLTEETQQCIKRQVDQQNLRLGIKLWASV